ncbi:7916_t:CDS:2 [Funneliformis geosporum]|uniref:RecQ-mediated genome instability protein 1 n=1 Tax=Funneliformis geosporum TaxID=1117311 RepID=A0A9W4SLA1_9GLOM|nr:7916_t:CDS:2 [Funneliformis geosporum]
MVPSEINESIFNHIEMTFSKTTFEFRRDGLEKALTKVLSEKEMIHINELLNRIYYELLHSELSDVIYPTLPNLNEFQNGYIAQNGPILLEIVECIEVGIPTYKLLQVLNEFESTQANLTEDKRESEAKLEFPRKMLYLLLSDGQQKIKGMEYKRIPELSLNTPIGKKVLINNVKYAENVLFLTPENTFICDGFEWTSRRPGDLKLTFMEILGMTIDESVEDESQISFNTLYPYAAPAFLSSDTGNRVARVVFEVVPNMEELTMLNRFLLKAETSNQPPRREPLYNKKRAWLYEEIDYDIDTNLELPPLKKVHTDDYHRKKLDGGSLTNPILLDYDDNDYERDLG